jgi:hypothetical protein
MHQPAVSAAGMLLLVLRVTCEVDSGTALKSAVEIVTACTVPFVTACTTHNLVILV